MVETFCAHMSPIHPRPHFENDFVQRLDDNMPAMCSKETSSQHSNGFYLKKKRHRAE